MRRFAWLTGVVLFGACSWWLASAAAAVSSLAAGRCYTNVADAPAREVGLVLGCAPRLPDGRRNLYFDRRIKAAAELYAAGKVEYLLVSGDNGRREYDEPSAMRDALMLSGVPRARITLDYAGFRTLDSVIRAKEVFGLKSFIVVSQRFQNERAIFIAQANGIDAVGYDAADVVGLGGLKTRAREVLARMRVVIDVSVIGARPRHLGPKVPVGRSST